MISGVCNCGGTTIMLMNMDGYRCRRVLIPKDPDERGAEFSVWMFLRYGGCCSDDECGSRKLIKTLESVTRVEDLLPSDGIEATNVITYDDILIHLYGVRSLLSE